MRYTTGKIASILNGEIRGNSQVIVSSAMINSKDNKEQGLFFALPGKRVNGHMFIEDAYRHGAVCAVVNKWIHTNIPIIQIKVEDTLKALGKLAKCYIDAHKNNIKHVLTITGSNGKTTTKEMISAVLSTKYRVAKTLKSYNTEYGLPYTILNEIDESIQFCVFEFGAQRAGDIQYLANIVPYDLTLITNIGFTHLEAFGSVENLAREKRSIVENLMKDGIVFLNADDKRLLSLKVFRDDLEYIYFGLSEDKHIYVPVHLIDSGLDFITLRVFYNGKWQKLRINVGGEYNASNCAAAITVGWYLDIPWEAIKHSLEQFTGVSLRWDVKDIGRCKVILDCYNANPISMRVAIRTLVRISATRRFLVLGDMLELGKAAEREHESLGGFISDIDEIDGLFLLDSHLTRCIEKGINEQKKVIKAGEIKELAESIRKTLKRGDLILIKGSRKMQMEKILNYL